MVRSPREVEKTFEPLEPEELKAEVEDLGRKTLVGEGMEWGKALTSSTQTSSSTALARSSNACKLALALALALTFVVGMVVLRSAVVILMGRDMGTDRLLFMTLW